MLTSFYDLCINCGRLTFSMTEIGRGDQKENKLPYP
jgi:hypothetical protein